MGLGSAAKHWSFQVAPACRLNLPSDFPTFIGRNRAHLNNGCALELRQRRLLQKNILNRPRVLQSQNDEVGIADGSLRRRGDRGTLGAQYLGFGHRAVPDTQRVALVQQSTTNGRAHQARPQDCDLHEFSFAPFSV